MALSELPESTILYVLVGSTSHGTAVEGQDDRDEIVVYVEDPTQCLGVGHGAKNRMERTQPEGSPSGPGDIDRQLYPLRNFLRLAVQGNPSILAALWSPPLHPLTPWARTWTDELLRMRHRFIGRHIIPRYRGYMRSQLLHLLGEKGGRHGSPRQDLVDLYGYDTKYAMHAVCLGFQCRELLLANGLQLPMVGEDADWVRSVRTGQVPLEDVVDVAVGLDAELAAMERNPHFPAGPDRALIEDWSVDCHLSWWSEKPSPAGP